jgi:hypothetical protein
MDIATVFFTGIIMGERIGFDWQCVVKRGKNIHRVIAITEILYEVGEES